jgi:hypothetical protein
MKSLKSFALVLFLVTSTVFAASDAERKFIREGMSEGEVLMKIGKPDAESEDTGGGARIAQKRWTYFPSAGDPQTLTVITLRQGKVIEVSRQISR